MTVVRLAKLTNLFFLFGHTIPSLSYKLCNLLAVQRALVILFLVLTVKMLIEDGIRVGWGFGGIFVFHPLFALKYPISILKSKHLTASLVEVAFFGGIVCFTELTFLFKKPSLKSQKKKFCERRANKIYTPLSFILLEENLIERSTV